VQKPTLKSYKKGYPINPLTPSLTFSLKMKNLLTLFLFVLLLLGCSKTNEIRTQVVIIEDRYSLELPTFLKIGKNINDEASLQYQNRLMDFYVIVIDEPKDELSEVLIENEIEEKYSDDFTGYSQLLLDGFEFSIENARIQELSTTEINSMPAKLITINGKVEGFDIFYYVGFFEGKETYYQVLAWTLERKEEKFKESMSKIMNSMTEI
jgi:hypothetical protein